MKKKFLVFKLVLPFILLLFPIACGLFTNRGESPETVEPFGTDIETTPIPEIQAVPGTEMPAPHNLDPTPLPSPSPGPLADETQDANESSPVLKVAYVKNGDVRLWTELGSSIPLTESGAAQDVKLSEDGQVVAFTRSVGEVNAELWAVNTDGSSERQLVDVTDLADMDPGAVAVVPYRFEWIPGTHTLAYNTAEVLEGVGQSLYDDLRLVDADTLEHSTPLAPGLGGDFYFSPDGRQVAVVSPTRIHLAGVGEENRREALNYERVITYSEYEYYPSPVWRSDSSALLVAVPPSDPLAQPPLPTAVWQIPADGSPAVQLGSVPADFFSLGVEFSPDLARLAYIRTTGNLAENLRELHIANVDGSQDKIIFTGPFLQFQAWAGDSNRFLFQTGEPALTQLGQVDGEIRELSDNPIGLFDVRWLDSERIIYWKGSGDQWVLILQTLGGQATVVDSISGPMLVYDVTQ